MSTRTRRHLTSNSPGSMTVAAICSVAALFAVPALAQASPSDATSSPGMVLDVEPPIGDPEVHNLSVSYSPGAYTVRDSAGVISSDLSCAPAGETTTKTCPDVGYVIVEISGGGLSDTLSIRSVGPPVVANLAAGDSTYGANFTGGSGNDVINGSPVNDIIGGHLGNDRMFGNGGADQIQNLLNTQNDGKDFIDGGPGPDLMSGDTPNGGRSVDTVSYASRSRSQPIKVFLNGLAVSGGALDSKRDRLIYIENVVGGRGNDVIKSSKKSPGRDAFNDIANNRLLGLGGADKLFGGFAADKLVGGKGRDLCNGGAANDKAKKCEIKRSL